MPRPDIEKILQRTLEKRFYPQKRFFEDFSQQVEKENHLDKN
jgi:hypothetical protein